MFLNPIKLKKIGHHNPQASISAWNSESHTLRELLASLVSIDPTTNRLESRTVRTKSSMLKLRLWCWDSGCRRFQRTCVYGILVSMEFYMTWNIPILQLPMWNINRRNCLPRNYRNYCHYRNHSSSFIIPFIPLPHSYFYKFLWNKSPGSTCLNL